jgi:hypothetical protein
VAATLHFFLLPEDERALLRQLARHHLTLYPELVPPGYQAPPVVDGLALEEEAYYLAAERLGPVVAHPVKRGPRRGLLEIEEVPSPVLHLQRSLVNGAGELVAGRLWVELNLTDAATSQPGKPRALRQLFEELQAWCRKSLLRSDPKGHWVGPRAAEAWRRGELVLREAGHRGRTCGVWR